MSGETPLQDLVVLLHGFPATQETSPYMVPANIQHRLETRLETPIRAREEEKQMTGLMIKSTDSPEEVRQFVAHGHADVVDLAGHPVIYGTFEPGWRWSEDVKPIAKTDSCQAPHLIYCISGRMGVRMADGTEGELGPGDVVSIAPGHDAWTVGDEACIAVDFGGYAQYAKG